MSKYRYDSKVEPKKNNRLDLIEYEERKIRLLNATGHSFKAMLYKIYFKIRRR